MKCQAQAGIKIAGRNINNLRYADDTTLMAESEEELKSFPVLGPQFLSENKRIGLALMLFQHLNSDLLKLGKWKSSK